MVLRNWQFYFVLLFIYFIWFLVLQIHFSIFLFCFQLSAFKTRLKRIGYFGEWNVFILKMISTRKYDKVIAFLLCCVLFKIEIWLTKCHCEILIFMFVFLLKCSKHRNKEQKQRIEQQQQQNGHKTNESWFIESNHNLCIALTAIRNF